VKVMVGFAIAAVLLLGSSEAPALNNDVCPMTVRVRSDGTFMTYRFNGWRVTSTHTLESDLRVGCYNDANPSKVTSVTVEASGKVPSIRLRLLYDLFARNGWPPRPRCDTITSWRME
jgi:hypothetical protein